MRDNFKIVEIIGPRQSGRTTKLRELLENDILKCEEDDLYIVVSTDLKMREVYGYAIGNDRDTTIMTINPVHGNIYLAEGLNITNVDSLTFQEAFNVAKSVKRVFVYIDNITLPNTSMTVTKLLPNIPIDVLYYTGLTYHYTSNRKLIKGVLGINDLGDINFNSIKIKAMEGNE